MSQSVLGAAAWSFVLGLPLLLAAAEKGAKPSPKSGPADARGKKEVLSALEAEAAGDNARRNELLATAAELSPELPEANWHLGRVRAGNEWLALAAAEARAAADTQLAEYCQLRGEAEGHARLLRSLARWCLKAGWEDTARLHYAQLLARNDLDETTAKEAIERLDLHPVAGRWITGEELKAQRERAKAIESSLKTWRPQIKRLQLVIDGGEYRAQSAAIKDLQAIDDPQAIAALESFQIDGGDRFCEEAARLLGKFREVEASEALVRYAILSPFTGAREAAIDGLKQRPKHEYVPLLLSGLSAPIKSQYSVSVGKRGTIQFTTWTERENANVRVVNRQTTVARPDLMIVVGQHLDARLTAIDRTLRTLSAVRSADFAGLSAQLAAISQNAKAAGENRRVYEVLEQVTGAAANREVNQWWKWWQDYNEYQWPQQTYYTYQTQPTTYFGGVIPISCFIAGTLVRTQTGLAAIETLKPGDRVLSQDQDTGELAYKVVLRTTIRPPTKMVKITAAGEEIVTTLGHPLWVDGHGWKMAKELSAGDLVHSLFGAAPIESVEPAEEAQAHNLVVDDFNTYFVGRTGVLVHDNEFRKPTRAVVPGLVRDK